MNFVRESNFEQENAFLLLLFIFGHGGGKGIGVGEGDTLRPKHSAKLQKEVK